MARLAIAKGFLGEYAKLDSDVQRAVDAAIARFARHPHPGQHLTKPTPSRDERLRFLPVDNRWRGVVLAPDAPEAAPAAAETYCLVTVLPQDQANDYAASRQFSVNQTLSGLEVHHRQATQTQDDQVALVSGAEELQDILAHPFAAWRTFLHPSQRDIAYQASYAGPAQVTGGPGTGKTVTVLHRAALLAERAAPAQHAAPAQRATPPVLITT